MRAREARVALAWGALWLGSGCAPSEAPPTLGDILPDGVDYALIEMRTFLTREGVRRARVEADTAEFHGEDEVHLRPLTLTFYDDQGRESTTVTADFGIYYERTEDMDALGSVVAVDQIEDQRLETEKLRYVNAEDRLYGDTTFQLRRDAGLTSIEGSAFESDPALDSIIVITPSGQSDRALTRAAPRAARPGASSVDSTAAVEIPDASLLGPDEGDSTVAVVEPDSTAVSPDSVVLPVDPAADTSAAPPDTSRVLGLEPTARRRGRDRR